MVYLNEKEAAVHEQYTIDQPCFQARPPTYCQDRTQETLHARFCGFCQVFLVTLRQKTCQEIGLSLEERLGEGKIC